MIENSNMQTKIPGVLVLGIGNFLMGDEGVGVHYISKYHLQLESEHVEVLDGGTGGFHLMSYFEQHRKVILIDATIDGKPAGSITKLKPRFSSDFPTALSAHDIGLKDLIEALIISDRLPEIFLFTVSIEEIQNMVTSLSPKVSDCLKSLHAQVVDLISQIKEDKM